MILDTPCSIDGCTAHVDLVRAEFDNGSFNWIHYFNCLGGHHYIQVAGHLLVKPEDFYESMTESEETLDYYQPTLFDEDDDSALD